MCLKRSVYLRIPIIFCKCVPFLIRFFLMPGTVPLFGLVPHAERLMFSSAATGGYQHRP
jgi:hypothetical protein